MLRRQKWTSEEDERLAALMTGLRGAKTNWEELAAKLHSLGISKQPKQIRERWTHHLSPRVNRLALSKAENGRLFELHQVLGCHWKQISEHFAGKTDNHIKNLFFAQIRKSLRKARKLSSKGNAPDFINSIKPKVLSNFVTKELAVPEDLRMPDRTLPWLSSSTILVRHFIIHFAYLRPADLHSLGDPRLTKLIDFVLSQLEEANVKYCESKEVTAPPQQSSMINPTATESQILRTSSMRLLANEFRFHLNTAEKDLQCSNPDKVYLTDAFEKIGNLALQISAMLKGSGESKNELKELSKRFSSSDAKPLLQDDVLPPEANSLNGKFIKNSRVSLDNRLSFVDLEDNFRVVPKPDENSRVNFKMEDSTRILNKNEENTSMVNERDLFFGLDRPSMVIDHFRVQSSCSTMKKQKESQVQEKFDGF